jgi:cytochrome b6-f complex iron-sulfur subunit
MPDQDEDRAAERVDQLVENVLGGRRVKATPSDAAERDAILAAAGLAGSREGYPRMSPAFKRRLEGLLQGLPEPRMMTRRAALVAGLGVAAGGIAGAMVERVARPAALPHTAAKPVPDSPLVPEDIPAMINPLPETQKWWDTGIRAEDLAQDVPVRVSAGSVGAFIMRRGNMVVAMSAYCTHLPCELEWLAQSRVLNCPCHNSAFNLNGVSLGKSPYRWPTLPAVNVRVSNGTVEVLGTA